MLDRLQPSALLVDHLEWIEKVAAMVCRRNSVWGEDAEDFAALAKMKVVENDYAVLRKFRGECELTTYLATVVVQRFHEYARERWGRWRHSAAAERLGPLAKDLESLVWRDGCTLHEAGERLRTAGRTTASDGELARLFAQLPARAPLRPRQVGADPLEWQPGVDQADGRVIEAEDELRRNALAVVLDGALARLEPEDRVIVRMHFADGRTVAEVARALHLDQKALYRRVEKLRVRLRQSLEEAGISRADIVELIVGRTDEDGT